MKTFLWKGIYLRGELVEILEMMKENGNYATNREFIKAISYEFRQLPSVKAIAQKYNISLDDNAVEACIHIDDKPIVPVGGEPTVIEQVKINSNTTRTPETDKIVFEEFDKQRKLSLRHAPRMYSVAGLI